MLTRNYSGSDGNMIANSRTIHSLFLTDIAAFTNFDNTLDANFATNWLSAITAAETVVRDSTLVDQQTALTNAVLNNMELCKQKYGDMRFFVRKAFPKNISVLNEFGNNDYRNAQRNQGKMILFMDGLFKAATKYTSQLIAAGLSQTKIDEIETLGKALRDANVLQEAMKRGRPVLTDDRIEVLNTCYSTSLMVSEAAQRAFVGNTNKIKQYRIINTRKRAKVLTNIEGNIEPGALLDLGLLPVGAKVLRLVNGSNAILEIGLGVNNTAFSGNTASINGNGTIEVDIKDLNSTGNMVLLLNQSTGIAGSYKVQVLG